MMPGSLNEQQQMLRMQQAYGMQMNGDLRKNAMNNRGGFNQAYVQQFFLIANAEYSSIPKGSTANTAL